jgi:hypothetical protein
VCTRRRWSDEYVEAAAANVSRHGAAGQVRRGDACVHRGAEVATGA